MRCAPRAAHERASSARAMVPRHHFESELRAGRARPRSLADIGLWQREHLLVLPAVDRLARSCKALPGPRRIVRRAIVCVVPR